MKSLLYTIYFIFLVGCSGNTENENCKFLLDISFNVPVNLSLPQYSQLQFAGNSVYVPNAGNGGIIIASTGADFLAWDARDPNHIQTECSILVNSGLNATCGCDDKNAYNLVTGQAIGSTALPCSLRNYRVEINGDILYISN
jgi:nitrite reductase/ring-hydroxylating ferredoxin subunit